MQAANVFAAVCKTKPLKVDSSGKERTNCFITSALKHMTLPRALYYLPFVTGDKNMSLIYQDDENPITPNLGVPDTCMITTTALYLYCSYENDTMGDFFLFAQKVTTYFKTSSM